MSINNNMTLLPFKKFLIEKENITLESISLKIIGGSFGKVSDSEKRKILDDEPSFDNKDTQVFVYKKPIKNNNKDLKRVTSMIDKKFNELDRIDTYELKSHAEKIVDGKIYIILGFINTK